jgi:hypothetical protein
MANRMVGTKSLKLDRITGLRADAQNGVGVMTKVPVIKREICLTYQLFEEQKHHD